MALFANAWFKHPKGPRHPEAAHCNQEWQCWIVWTHPIHLCLSNVHQFLYSLQVLEGGLSTLLRSKERRLKNKEDQGRFTYQPVKWEAMSGLTQLHAITKQPREERRVSAHGLLTCGIILDMPDWQSQWECKDDRVPTLSSFRSKVEIDMGTLSLLPITAAQKSGLSLLNV
jgi:hypothetical protein